MTRFLQSALIIQIALIFFPPLPVGGRSLFLSDVWILIWATVVFYYLLRNLPSAQRSVFILKTVLLYLIFLLIALHGYYRPELSENFMANVGSSKDNRFNLVRETAVGFRFATWILAGWLVTHFRIQTGPLLRTLAILCSIASLVMVAAWIQPQIGVILGKIYGYVPTALPWPERIYGLFRSPIEACAALSIAALFLLTPDWGPKHFRSITILVIFVGILLSKTLTAFLALIIAVAYQILYVLPRRTAILTLSAFTLGSIPILLVLWNSGFFAFKFANFIFRLKPWAFYWEMISSTWHHLLLGAGFMAQFSDNMIIFLVSRGGTILLVLALGIGFYSYKKGKSYFGPTGRSIFLFLIISSIAVDILAIRPVAYILISVGLPLLVLRRASAETE